MRFFSKKIIANYNKNVKDHSSMCKGKKQTKNQIL
jgi:hypothetical protein